MESYSLFIYFFMVASLPMIAPVLMKKIWTIGENGYKKNKETQYS